MFSKFLSGLMHSMSSLLLVDAPALTASTHDVNDDVAFHATITAPLPNCCEVHDYASDRWSPEQREFVARKQDEGMHVIHSTLVRCQRRYPAGTINVFMKRDSGRGGAAYVIAPNGERLFTMSDPTW